MVRSNSNLRTHSAGREARALPALILFHHIIIPVTARSVVARPETVQIILVGHHPPAEWTTYSHRKILSPETPWSSEGKAKQAPVAPHITTNTSVHTPAILCGSFEFAGIYLGKLAEVTRPESFGCAVSRFPSTK